jgi:hypothetical protein
VDEHVEGMFSIATPLLRDMLNNDKWAIAINLSKHVLEDSISTERVMETYRRTRQDKLEAFAFILKMHGIEFSDWEELEQESEKAGEAVIRANGGDEPEDWLLEAIKYSLEYYGVA